MAEKVSYETIKRMAAFFSRHEKKQEPAARMMQEKLPGFMGRRRW
jgi:hypothetical protein